MQNQQPTNNGDSNQKPSGYRLRRLEMLNWGTFHGKVQRLIADENWTMLVGVNGTGKSTAADALRTLLVPPTKLSYNDASGDHRQRSARRDRTRRSYIRGAYGAQSQEDSATALTQYLRKPGEESILLAVFVNHNNGSEVTVAEILWEANEQIEAIFLVSRSEKNIKEHLTNLGNSRDAKKELRKRGFEWFGSFPGYEERFRQLLGIPGTGALEVFNQAIGVKEVTDLNQFVQKHLLEPSTTLEFIDTHLKPHYEQLNACWEAIKKAEEQSVKLVPIAQCHERITTAQIAKDALEEVQKNVPNYFRNKELALRVAYDEEIELAICDLEQKRNGLDTLQRSEREKLQSLIIAKETDEVGSRIRDIEREETDAKRERDERLKCSDKIKQHLLVLQMPTPLDTEAQFNTLRQRLSDSKGTLEGNLDAQKKKELEHAVAKTRAEDERKAIGEEAQSVRDNRVLIPHKLIDVRREISQRTGVPLAELPFAGELMEVKAEHKVWTGAIERLLHGFGVSLLVPENRYLQVARFINGSHLGVRLTFHRVPNAQQQIRREVLADNKKVPSRINFLEEHALIDWVKSEVARRFAHTCCSDVQQLNLVDYGITKEGLIRDGTRHVKDDRSQVTDRSNYVLGWSTQTKLAALQEAFTAACTRIAEHEEKRGQAAEKVKQYSARLGAIDAILEVQNFDQVNFRIYKEKLSKLNTEKEELKKSSTRVQELERQIQKTETEIEQRGNKIRDFDTEIGTKRGELQNNRTEVTKLRKAIEGIAIDLEKMEAELAKFQSKPLKLENIFDVRESIQEKLTKQVEAQTRAITAATNEMLPIMQKFLTSYPEETANLKAAVSYGAEFVALKETIDNEKLPEHKTKFSSFLTTNLIMDVAAFSTKLSQDEQANRTRIDAVNKSLRNVEFGPGTYVYIFSAPTKSNEINLFKAQLKGCLHKGINPTPEEQNRIFNNIRELILKLEKERDWAVRVTDVRNWLEYGVKEIYAADGKEAEYYSASTGKSGGQKSKMAFAILASAITAQYGITGTKTDEGRFRLVVIDEAFARTDEENSLRGLELFKKLDLQLVIVNPFDAKSRIAENYVHSFHLVSIADEISNLRRATRADYESEREANL